MVNNRLGRSVEYVRDKLNRFFDGVWSLVSDHWNWLDTLILTDEFQTFVEISLIATLIASLITLSVMIYYRIRNPLDGGYFLREVGLSCVIGGLFLSRFLSDTVPFRLRVIVYVSGYFFLLISSVAIVITLIREHRMSDQEITKELNGGKDVKNRSPS